MASRHPASKLQGSKLNLLLHHHETSTIRLPNGALVKPFNPYKKYQCCYNLKRLVTAIEKKGEKELGTSINSPEAAREEVTLLSPPTTRTRLPPITPSPTIQYGLRSNSSGNNKRSIDEIAQEEVEVEVEVVCEDEIARPPIAETSTRPSRRSNTNIFEDDVLRNYYKVKFRDLVMKERKRRKLKLAKDVIGMCIDRNEFKNKGMNYLEKNSDVAISMLDLIDGVKVLLEKYLKASFKSICADEVLLPIDGDVDGLIEKLSPEQAGYELAMRMMGETTMNGYERLRRDMEGAGGIEGVDLPSAYTIKKKRPRIVDVSFTLVETEEEQEETRTNIRMPEELGMELVPAPTNAPANNTMTEESSLTALNAINDETALIAFAAGAANPTNSDNNNTTIIQSNRLEGTYENYIDMLKEKQHVLSSQQLQSSQEQQSASGLEEGENSLLVIDSIDGAEHHRSKKSITSIISYSSSLITPELINNKITTSGSSLNILTFQQMIGKECPATMLPSVETYLKEKQVFRSSQMNKVTTTTLNASNENNDLLNENNNLPPTANENENTSTTQRTAKIYCYECHDVKMLYLLTQHSQWNRKHHPFLRCKCKRGRGVRKGSRHVCTLRDDGDEKVLFNASKERWERKINEEEEVEVRAAANQRYTKKSHLDWCDKHNKGVTHFGVHPDLLPRSEIRFDTFHLKCSITRRLMESLRILLDEQSDDIRKQFLREVLSKFWNEFHLLVWKTGRKFSSFQGNELALFVANIELINQFLQTNLVPTSSVTSILQGLNLWVVLFSFLGKSRIDTGMDYLNEVDKYEKNATSFYKAGKRTYLAKGGIEGEDESCYMHVMRFWGNLIDVQVGRTDDCDSRAPLLQPVALLVF
jgi:DNA-directed RNA polymerase subunit M/transcription elongation factor TFIIS